jgi:hypothetical protein
MKIKSYLAIAALSLGLVVLPVNATSEPYTVDHVVSVDSRYVDGVVHLLLGKKIAGEDSLWYQTSSDQGATWSQAINITKDQKIQARFSRGNDARLAVQGDHIAVVWMTRKEGAPHNSGPMMAMVSHDAGQSWKTIASPADWPQGSHGFFALDATDSEMSLTWLDSRQDSGQGAAQGLQYAVSQDGGETWSKNITLDSRTCACCWNSAHYDDAGQFYIIYRDKDPSDMAIGKVDQNQHWQRLSTVGQFDWDFQGCPHIGGNFAIDEKHDVFHASVGTGHQRHTGAYYLNSHDQGKTWSEPHRLGGETAVHSDVATLNSGTVLTAWDEITEQGYRVSYALSQDQGASWSDSIAVSTLGERATHPITLAMDNAFLLMWTEGKDNQAGRLSIRKIAR